MVTTIVDLANAPSAGDTPGTPIVADRRRRRLVRLPRSRKMTVGLVLLGLFVILAVIGPWIAPYDPGHITLSTAR